MSKYDKFEDFMQTVINEADAKCQAEYNKTLAEAYDVSQVITTMVKMVISGGWWVFIALAALLTLGPFGFGAALLAFVANPVGMIVCGALAAFGGIAAVRTLYKNKVLPLAVKATGEMYKADFEQHINHYSYIDNLIEKATTTLLDKATRLLR